MLTQRKNPLDGIRVLDIGTNIAGPFGATLLGEFGAEVIKVEQPGSGDPARRYEPIYNNKSLTWSVLARNKKSITLDFRQQKGQELFRKLAVVSDVIIESFRPGTMEKWNLGYDVLKEINPKIILTRVSAFGQTGPYKNRGGYDRIASAMGGIMYLTGFPDAPPVRVGLNLTDEITGLFNAIGTLLALYSRDSHPGGSGQIIDLGLTEAMIRLLEGVLAEHDKMGTIRERQGNENPIIAPADNILSSDGHWITFTITSDTLFEKFAKITGIEELANNPKFKTNSDRLKNSKQLYALIRSWFSKKTVEEIKSCFEPAGIPYGLIYNAQDIINDPQNIARENIVTVRDSQIGSVKMQAVVPKLSLTPGKIVSGGPDLGEHNHEVYQGLLGLQDKEFEELHKSGVI